ncbi:hypothetical protein SDC9_79075 [bioreactor metagenome]|uniref:Uncharacterized protein n=1 Tax=bioreactor metagenome TaxID=1076179 RepID=A0A644YVL5_9ZZZZ
MDTIEIGRIDRIVVHQREVPDTQPSQQRNHGTARATASDHPDAQRTHDGIEVLAEQCGLSSQKLRIFTRRLRAPDIDLAPDNRDGRRLRGCLGRGPQAPHDGIVLAKDHAGKPVRPLVESGARQFCFVAIVLVGEERVRARMRVNEPRNKVAVLRLAQQSHESLR